jgi:O-antigen/teichoic acid export membrane protein
MALGIKRYRKFPLLDSWSSLLNAISWQLPTFILSAFFSAKVVGYYALGMNVLQLPMLLVETP